MGKIIIIIVMAFMVGCGGKLITVKTEVQETLVPILYSPKPPHIPRPSLPIHDMTQEEILQPGALVKRYHATLEVLLGYARELERALKEYDVINKAYTEQRDELQKKLGLPTDELPVE